MKYQKFITEDCVKYYRDYQLHRVDGPAIEYTNGCKEWYLNGELHREGGPASEDEYGTKEWYINGELHREDGPAIEWSDGEKEWYLNGEEFSEEKFNQYISSISDTDVYMINGAHVTKEEFEQVN